MTSRFSRSAAALAAVTAAFALALTGCATSDSSSPLEGNEPVAASSIRMGTQPWLGYGQWYVAEEQGYFGDVAVELSSFNADSDVNAALVAKQIDVANVGAQAALQFIEQGLEVSIVMLLDSATEADAILASTDLESVSELAGKSVAFERGATSEILLSEALEAEGLDMDDIDAVEASADQIAPMLIAGKVDAGVTYEPYVSEALGADDEIGALATAGEYPGLITDVLVVRNEVLDARPDDVRALITAWDKSVAYYDENTDAARDVIAIGVGSRAEDLESAFDGVHFYSLAENRELLEGEYLSETLPALAKVAKRIGLIEGAVSADSAIRAEFLNAK